MGYIMNLRKKIGHNPVIMVSGCVLILNEKNQVLLQKRKIMDIGDILVEVWN